MVRDNNYDQTVDSLYDYLFCVLNLYREALPVLKQELESIEQDDLITLDKMLRSQQVLLLQTKSFNKNIANYFSLLNISGENLTAVIQQLPENEHMRFYNLLGQFEFTMKEVIFYKEKCHMMLHTKLYKIEKVLSRQAIQRDSTTYNKDALEIPSALFPKSFKTTI